MTTPRPIDLLPTEFRVALKLLARHCDYNIRDLLLEKGHAATNSETTQIRAELEDAIFEIYNKHLPK